MHGFDDAGMLQRVLESLPTGVCVINPQGKVVFWNDGAERISGFLRQEILGKSNLTSILGITGSVDPILSEDTQPEQQALRDGKGSEAEVSLQHKLGHRVLLRLRTAPLRDLRGNVIAVVECFEDNLSLAEWDRRQNKLATHGFLDHASGVLNHALIQAHLQEHVQIFQEHPVPFSILCLSIDGLDKIQSRFGMPAVAVALRVVGQTLENGLRPTDYLGRWNENEFLAVVTECTAAEAPRVADRLRRMVEKSKFEWWGDSVPVAVSAGTAGMRAEDAMEDLLGRGETALRESVRRGGNQTMSERELGESGS
jgi:diguanylate cyclase (GGDEF)-like protein/PAS domain S-box-containing protein